MITVILNTVGALPFLQEEPGNEGSPEWQTRGSIWLHQKEAIKTLQSRKSNH